MAAEAYEFTVSGTLAGQFVQNVFHVNVDNTSSTNPYEVAEDVVLTANTTLSWFDLWTACLPEDYTITSVRCRRVLPTGGPTYIKLGATLSDFQGQRTGSIQAAQVNPLLIWITTLSPNKPGRTFLPGLSEADCDDMVYEAAVVTAFENFINVMVNNFATDTLVYDANFAVLRRTAGQSHDIAHGRVSPLVGTQRRRLRPV